MCALLLAVFIVVAVVVSAAPSDVKWFDILPGSSRLNVKVATDLSPYRQTWEEYKYLYVSLHDYDKKYTDIVEVHRYKIFEEMMMLIEIHNRKYVQNVTSYYMGVNQFSDMRQCGSCWAFSTTGTLEGQYANTTGKLLSLSEQQLVDCSKENNGCNGGRVYKALMYVASKGIETESNYPYTAKDGQCNYNSSRVAFTIKGCIAVDKNENALKEAVATKGPISVGIDANHPSFQSYKGGIYDEPICSSTHLDHGVLVVGYGTDGGKDYWLVKNSWGTVWGDEGYIKMSRNKDNQCGIATEASYPI